MKRLLLAAIFASMSVSAFAAEQAPVDENTSDDAIIEQEVTPQDATADRAWRFEYTCRASDRYGRTYWGRDTSRWQAEREALYSCRRHSFYSACYMRGCSRSFTWIGGGWGGGHGGWDGGHHGGRH